VLLLLNKMLLVKLKHFVIGRLSLDTATQMKNGRSQVNRILLTLLVNSFQSYYVVFLQYMKASAFFVLNFCFLSFSVFVLYFMVLDIIEESTTLSYSVTDILQVSENGKTSHDVLSSVSLPQGWQRHEGRSSYDSVSQLSVDIKK